MQLNPNIFFLAISPCLIVWDYKRHQQYELDKAYGLRLVELINNPSALDLSDEMDASLVSAGVFITDECARGEDDEWGWDVLSKIFHVGTKNIPQRLVPAGVEEWAGLYYEHCREVVKKPRNRSRVDTGKGISLPDPHGYNFESVSLTDALVKRKTCRAFDRREVLDILQVSAILYFSFGYLEERNRDEFVPLEFSARRSSPSGGGLNACEVYVYIGEVRSVEPGIYCYDPENHGLSFVTSVDEVLGDLLGGQHFINDIPFGVFLAARFDKMWWKYEHSRAYRVSLFDLGHLSQTFQLVCTAAGLKTWLTAALSENKLERLLGINTYHEQPLLFVGAGHSNGAVLCKELVDLLEKSDHE